MAAGEQRERQWAAGQATELAAAYGGRVTRMTETAGKAALRTPRDHRASGSPAWGDFAG
jgi:hypothetical protein